VELGEVQDGTKRILTKDDFLGPKTRRQMMKNGKQYKENLPLETHDLIKDDGNMTTPTGESDLNNDDYDDYDDDERYNTFYRQLESKLHELRRPQQTKTAKRIYKDYFRIRGMPSISDETSISIPSVFIPQLMMEMMCLGDDCKSAVMCRQTALNGAITLRIKRDDKWINEMIYWLEKYMTDYVNPEHVPQQNFFWLTTDDDDDDDAEGNGDLSASSSESRRYQAFVNWTKEISDGVEVVDYIPHSSIQRSLGENGLFLSLFLDDC